MQQQRSSQLPRFPDLADKLVFITGGASGIGAEFVRAFHEQGAIVAFYDIDQRNASALVSEISGKGPPVHYCAGDIRDIDALQRSIRTIHFEHGPLKVLINNAASDKRHHLQEVTPDFWNNCLALNLNHHFFAAQTAAPLMEQSGGGSIISMSSNSWMLGLPGYPGYATSKAGIVGMTKVLARELGPQRIRVNAILPGWVKTRRQVQDGFWTEQSALELLNEQQAIAQEITPHDVAVLALFLASEASRVITGQVHVADGGRL